MWLSNDEEEHFRRQMSYIGRGTKVFLSPLLSPSVKPLSSHLTWCPDTPGWERLIRAMALSWFRSPVNRITM